MNAAQAKPTPASLLTPRMHCSVHLALACLLGCVGGGVQQHGIHDACCRPLRSPTRYKGVNTPHLLCPPRGVPLCRLEVGHTMACPVTVC